ncbi:MAG: YbjN domain-containing protein [bacterium]|nr:YbjN domain-containing protein [bacterium]
MEIFDGFISAVASDFKIKFHKDSAESYYTTIQFENDRSQDVLITLAIDESGDRVINYYSVIGKLKKDLCELYKYALQLNTTFDYGSIALLTDTLILRNSILLQDCDPRRFMKSLTYIAAKADELEESLIKEDLY